MVDEKKQAYIFHTPALEAGDVSDLNNVAATPNETINSGSVLESEPTASVQPVVNKPDNDDKDDMSSQQPSVIRVANKDYAVNLFWQPLQDVDDPIPEIRENMEAEEGSALYTIHYGRAPQYGIGKKIKGHKEGQLVGAISVLDALSDKSSFVAVFKVPEGWWFLVVRNDLILPEEDILYTNEDDAKNAFFSMMAVLDWGYKIAPDSWGVDDTEEMDLESLIKNATQARLLGLSAARGTKILIAIAALILILICSIVAIVFSLIDRKTEVPTEITAVIPQASIQTVEPKREEEKPWEKLVEVNPFLQRCWNNAYQLKALQVPGWGLNQIVCTPTGISTGWTKTWTNGGRIAWLKSAIEEYQYKFKKTVQINESGNSATANIQFDKLPVIASVPMLSMVRLKQELVDISQAINLSISMSVQQLEVANPQGVSQNGEPPPPIIYRYLSFSFSSPMDPPAWESFFDKFAGLEVVKIEYNPRSESAASSNWKYEGRIYEKDK